MIFMKTRNAYVVGSARIPFVKSQTKYKDVSLQELMTTTLQFLVDKMHLENKIIGDVALGAIISSSANWNLARECVLGTTLDPHTPAYNIQRACGTGLEAVNQIALKISNFQIDSGIAGGCDSNSDLPILISPSLTNKLIDIKNARDLPSKIKILATLRPADFKLIYPGINEPRTGLSMGEHCEKMVKEWGISRKSQDQLSFKSHGNGVKAFKDGFYHDLVFEFKGLTRDSILREDTTLEKLATLKAAFDSTEKGTLTAGNSSPLTDGSAAVLVACEDFARLNDYSLLARFVDCETSAVDFVHGEGLLMAPTIAVSNLLKRNHLTLQEFDFYEIHEAFAGQVLCTLKAWESVEYCKNVLNSETALGSIDQTKINVKGGSVALGHPFAATGVRIVGSLAKMLHQKGSGRALISICTAGGMGIAAILESVT
jgi:acetyl-CoA C-acetyltransferase